MVEAGPDTETGPVTARHHLGAARVPGMTRVMGGRRSLRIVMLKTVRMVGTYSSDSFYDFFLMIRIF